MSNNGYKTPVRRRRTPRVRRVRSPWRPPIVVLLVAAVLWSASLWCGAALALDPKKAITQYSHDVWQMEDGLPNLKPAFYQTSFFYVLCVLGVVLIGVGAYRLRVRQMKTRERKLVGLVDDRTTELQQEINERQRAEAALRRAHDDLERRVQERTTELAEANVALRAEIAERQRAEEALRESEDRYRDLVEHSQDLICTHDLEGRILSVNRAAIEVLGYDPNDYIEKKNVRDILAPEFRDQFETYLATIGRDGAARGLMLVRTSSGEKRIWEYNNTLRTEGVAAPVVRGVAHDVTERWRAEKTLEQRNRHLSVLNSVGNAVSASLNVKEIMEILAEQLVQQMQFRTAFVWEYNESEKTAKLLAIYPRHPLLFNTLKMLGLDISNVVVPFRGDENIVHAHLLEGQDWVEYNSTDITVPTIPAAPALMAQKLYGVKSIHNVPIMSKGNLVGTIVVGSEQETIAEAERSIVLATAAQVAPAIENARLYEEAKREWLHSVSLMEVTNAINSTMQVDELLNLIVEKVLELTRSKHGSLFFLDEADETLTIHACRGVPEESIHLARFKKGEGIAGWVAETGQGVHIQDVETHPQFKSIPQIESYTSMIDVPMLVNGRVVGVLSVDRLQGEKPFTEAEFRIAQDFADQAALALANARLLEETQEKNRRLQKLYELSVVLAGDTQSIFDRIVSIVAELFDVPIVTIGELSKVSLMIRSIFLNGEVLHGGHYGLEGTPCQKILTGKMAYQSSHTLSEFPHDSFLQEYGIQTYLGVPILDRERNSIGVLNIMDSTVRSFTDDDTALLYTFSDRIYFELEEERQRKEQEEMDQMLRASEAKYRGLFENVLEGVYQSTPAGQLITANPALVQMLGYDSEAELLTVDIAQDLYVNPEERNVRVRTLEVEGELRNAEVVLKRKDGQPVVVLENARPVCDERGAMLCYEGMLRDITERKKVEAQIQASLKEKEVLLREIHHRVKNNLQVTSSLLNLQARYIKDEQALQSFKESQNRVRSMALIHEKLYQSRDLASIDLAEYIRSLAAHLFRSYGVSANTITLKVNMDDVFLSVDTAIPCGLIINELVSNSLKHAFPAGQAGEIRIELRSGDNHQLTLIISDNGVGFPPGVDFRQTESLGLQLVNMLTDQLGGTIELDRSGGTELKMTFAELTYKERE